MTRQLSLLALPMVGLLALGGQACGGTETEDSPDAAVEAPDAATSGSTDAGAGAEDSGTSTDPDPCTSSSNWEHCPGETPITTPTVKEAFDRFKAAADELRPGTWWDGFIIGRNLGRDGTTGGGGVRGIITSTSCFSGGYFDFSSESGCIVQTRCSTKPSCESDDAFAFPAVDSAAAILAAFPEDSDPENSAYMTKLNLSVDNNWTVVRGIETKYVDATTGEVLP